MSRAVEVEEVRLLRAALLSAVRRRKRGRAMSEPETAAGRALTFTSADVEYWRKQLARDRSDVGEWPDNDVLIVVARFIATLDALDATRAKALDDVAALVAGLPSTPTGSIEPTTFQGRPAERFVPDGDAEVRLSAVLAAIDSLRAKP